MASNLEMLKDVHHQLTNKAAWFWGHLADTILNHPVPWFGYRGERPTEGRNTISIATMIGWFDSGVQSIIDAADRNGAKLDGLARGITELGKQQGMDPAELERIIDAAVQEAANKHFSTLGTWELRKVEAPEPAEK